jgi:hypothetical protein
MENLVFQLKEIMSNGNKKILADVIDNHMYALLLNIKIEIEFGIHKVYRFSGFIDTAKWFSQVAPFAFRAFRGDV